MWQGLVNEIGKVDCGSSVSTRLAHLFYFGPTSRLNVISSLSLPRPAGRGQAQRFLPGRECLSFDLGDILILSPGIAPPQESSS